MSASPVQRREVSEYSLLLHERGWVANHDGNVSARVSGENRYLISPTAVSKRVCTPDTIVLIDGKGQPVGKGRPPSEVAMHLGAYRRNDVGAVIHAHSPFASAFSLANVPLGPVAMPEVVVSIGPEIPMVPLFAPKDPGVADAVEAALGRADVVLLSGNGLLAVGVDLEQAYLRAELVEHYAKILTHARALGGPQALEPSVMERLLELRRKAGLGPQGPEVVGARDQTPPTADHIRPIVAEEIRRALGGSK